MPPPENSITPAATIDTPQSASGAVADPAAHCKNCNAILAGRYCATCGQRADVHVPSTRELVHEALEGLTHSDSRLWRTLRLLWFTPGALTEEFLAGRRAGFAAAVSALPSPA
jgi:hypothetical protein